MRSEKRTVNAIGRRLIRGVGLAMVALVTALTVAAGSGDYPTWPLQQQPGPDGDPKQSPTTFPKSRVPPQKGQKRVRSPRLSLTNIGHGRQVLSGGWKLAAAPSVAATVKELSQPGFDVSKWWDATVPGTVLTTLVDEGVYPEPTYGLNNMAIPESLSREDYWYRTEFTPDAELAEKTLTLTFNGVNYSADVWLNGGRLGEIRGAFIRGIFDVTGRILAGKPNALVVRISPVPHPGIPHEESLDSGAGPNGGAMLFDGPTFFCTEGWDWIPGIRDRASGLWQDVVLQASGPVTIGDVQVTTDLPLPDTSSADVAIDVVLRNHTALEQKSVLAGEFEGASFEKAVTLAPRETRALKLASSELPALLVKKPRLWWPNGYGRPELYHLTLTVLDSQRGAIDSKAVRFGIREVTYELSVLDGASSVRRIELEPIAAGAKQVVDKAHGALRKTPVGWVPTFVPGGESMPAAHPLSDASLAPFLVVKVNGRRVVCKGGNWGLDEALKRVGRERLEPFIRMERDAHMTMIRNWCGQNTEEVFYELCDEYGLMVWNDFWASTQNWNLQPGDLTLWLANAEDTIKRFRNHPSIVLWCGRNEGVPPPALNEGLDALVREHDGSRYYQPSSVSLNLLESGPWIHGDPKSFFDKFGLGFTTELGLPSAPTADAMRAMMPAADLWPISDTWAYHDWHQADHGEVPVFMEAMARQFGVASGLDDFCRKAQMINYVGHRAMFEGLNANLWKPASGRLMWMSHPAWPSMEWQLYSSDYDPSGAYFGAMKAAEPIHVQWNLHDRKVVVTNNTFDALSAVSVEATLHDLSGRRLARQSRTVNAAPNATTEAFPLDETAVARLDVSFLKLVLRSRTGAVLSDNFYWLSKREEALQALGGLRQATLIGTARLFDKGGPAKVEVEVRNPAGSAVALLLKPTLRDGAGERILPAYVSDGGFSLLPGERRRFTIECPSPKAAMQVTFEGWNSAPLALPVQRWAARVSR